MKLQVKRKEGWHSFLTFVLVRCDYLVVGKHLRLILFVHGLDNLGKNVPQPKCTYSFLLHVHEVVCASVILTFPMHDKLFHLLTHTCYYTLCSGRGTQISGAYGSTRCILICMNWNHSVACGCKRWNLKTCRWWLSR